MCHFWAQNGPFVMNNIFLVQTIIITFIYLLAFFLVQNLGSKLSICPKQIFLWKIINIILIYLLAPFIVQNFKKSFQWIQSYEDTQFLGPKWPICQIRFFLENLLMSLASFIHAYLHAKIKVRYYSISEILTIKE